MEVDMVIEKVKEIIASQLNVSAEKITEESKLVEDLGDDSLDMVELLMAFEDEFSTTISDEIAVTIKTVSDIVKMIEAK